MEHNGSKVPTPTNVAIITVSDSAFRGERNDLSGPKCQEMLEKMGFSCLPVRVVPDESDAIANEILVASQHAGVCLVITTGGTGLSPRDHTPEATRRIIQREAPGIAEYLRAEGVKKTPTAALSRGIAGLCGHVLVINLPGSVRAVTEGLEALGHLLPHALGIASGETVRCGETTKHNPIGGNEGRCEKQD